MDMQPGLHTHQQSPRLLASAPGSGVGPGRLPRVRAVCAGARRSGEAATTLSRVCSGTVRRVSRRQRSRARVAGARPAAAQPVAVGDARNTERAASRRAASTCRGRGAGRGAGRGPRWGGAGRPGQGGEEGERASRDPPSAVPVRSPGRWAAQQRALGGQWAPTVTSPSHLP